MVKRCLLLLLIAGLSAILVRSADTYEPLPRELDGSMMIYDFKACDPVEEWPDSLHPFHALYVARHGARFLSSPKKVSKVEKALYEASTSGKITPRGTDFCALLADIARVTDGNWGALSPVGVEEQQRLAETLVALFPDIKEGERSLSACATFVPRAVMTMYQFCHRLTDINRQVEISTSEGPRFSPLLYFFETDSAYRTFRDKGAAWEEPYKKCVDAIVPTAPARRLLGENASNDNHHLRDLTLEIYDVIQSNPAAGLPQATTRWMTEEEYRACWTADNYLHYLRNTVNPLSDAARGAVSELVNRICADGDNAAENPDSVGVFNGYFGHAETLMPLLSVLQIPGCHAMTLDWNAVADQWKVQDVVPLGANLLVVMLRADSGRVYAAVRLNGRNVSPIPGRPAILEWNELSRFWKSTLDPVSALSN